MGGFCDFNAPTDNFGVLIGGLCVLASCIKVGVSIETICEKTLSDRHDLDTSEVGHDFEEAYLRNFIFDRDAVPKKQWPRRPLR